MFRNARRRAKCTDAFYVMKTKENHVSCRPVPQPGKCDVCISLVFLTWLGVLNSSDIKPLANVMYTQVV